VIQAAGQKGYAIKADHAVQSEVTQSALVAESHKLLGGLDILVNNVGVCLFGRVTDAAARAGEFAASADRDRQFAINVTSIATAVRAAVRVHAS
jgi:3-oxoacyl-[acyl-carrier protein] reductase